ncbi:MAG: MBL fold metallo-hydrolase, partial [Rhodospirillaceae bacterium]
MKLTILGTGTPAPSLKRACSGYMIEVGDDLIVMDHGPDAHRRLLESGKRATDVTHVFFTHLHYDHCLDYARLVLQRWDMGAGKLPELKVYGPPPIARMTEQLFGDDGVWAPDLDARTGHRLSLDIYELRGGVLPRVKPMPEVHEIHPGDTVGDNGWTVRVAEASHVQPYLQCHAYRLDGPG